MEDDKNTGESIKFFCCPECGARYKIQLDGKRYRCKKCNESFQVTDLFSPSPIPATKERRPALRWIGKVIFGGMVFFAIVCFIICVKAINEVSEKPHAQQGGTASPAPQPNPVYAPKLELLSWTWSEEYDYLTATGEVKNISAESMEAVEVVTSYYDSNDNFVKSADAVIDYNPILPGQTSPFKTMTTANPAIKKASLQFKYLFGGTIPSRQAGK